jgi:hypothetical protein
MWNHFPAAAYHSRQPVCTIPSQRAKRLSGKSRMNFVSLVIHGLSAISVYNEVMGIRMLILGAVLTLMDLAGIALIVYIRLGTDLAIPGWATFGVGILTILFLLLMMMMVVFVFVSLSGRDTSSFMPKRDYAYFILGIRPYTGAPSP